LPFASESVSILCANCVCDSVCVCCVSVCIRVYREGHVAPKCDQTVKRQFVRTASSWQCCLARTGVPAARARTHDGGCFGSSTHLFPAPGAGRPRNRASSKGARAGRTPGRNPCGLGAPHVYVGRARDAGLAICASACLLPTAAAAGTERMRRGTAAGLLGCQIGTGSCS